MVQTKTVGIIGGVGPAATAELFKKIVDNTLAGTDFEHIRVLMDNNPRIPDRTTAIKEKTEAPVELIVKAGKGLISIGADFLVIPCVTAHFFYDKISSKLSVPMINLVEETAEFCKKSNIKKVGVLATTGTCNAHLFDAKMREYDIEVLYPNDSDQEKVMHIIYDKVKAGKPADKNLLKPCITDMSKNGATAIILGCTELPLVLSQGDFNVNYIDVLDVLAKAIIKNAGGTVR